MGQSESAEWAAPTPATAKPNITVSDHRCFIDKPLGYLADTQCLIPG
jgi:hypothetical protein